MTEVMKFVETLPPEEAARANFYGLLARLFYAPPDAALLEAIAGADEIEAEDGGIGEAWQALARAAAGADPEALREEYETLFVGTGKAPVTPYVSAYLIRYSNDAPLVDLRSQLAALGLARRNEVHEPEDHIAALCEVMRHLIAAQTGDLEGQKRFFERWIWPSAQPLCNAIKQSDKARFYKAVAGFLLGLCTVEHMGFEML
ncbi:MAG: TorD/DmsD family molecular chaperone [Burkholderiales bacterium]